MHFVSCTTRHNTTQLISFFFFCCCCIVEPLLELCCAVLFWLTVFCTLPAQFTFISRPNCNLVTFPLFPTQSVSNVAQIPNSISVLRLLITIPAHYILLLLLSWITDYQHMHILDGIRNDLVYPNLHRSLPFTCIPSPSGRIFIVVLIIIY